MSNHRFQIVITNSTQARYPFLYSLGAYSAYSAYRHLVGFRNNFKDLGMSVESKQYEFTVTLSDGSTLHYLLKKEA